MDIATALPKVEEHCPDETAQPTMREPVNIPTERVDETLNPAQHPLFNYLSIQAVPSTSSTDETTGDIEFDTDSTHDCRDSEGLCIHHQSAIPCMLDGSFMAPSELTFEESKSRVAVRFLMKKSKRFCDAINLRKPVVDKSSKIKKLMSTLKDSVKSTIASGMPSSQTISGITSSLVSTLKGQRLPDCLQFLGFQQMTSRHRSRRNRGDKTKRLSMTSFIRKSKCKTFVNWERKPEPEPEGGHQFARPEVYNCSYCNTNICKQLYLKHIRRHRNSIVCETCSKSFRSIIDKRRHQLKCSRRAIL